MSAIATNPDVHIAVVGAGQAAASLVVKLRSLGFDGRLTVIGEEAAAPYQRPPLSKKYLLGEMSADRLLLRPDVFYSENRIELLLGTPVTRLDTTARTLFVGNRPLRFDMLALTTGARPRKLPAGMGGSLTGIHTIRTRADVDSLAPEFAEGRHLLVVGGGYIGLEAAAVAARGGLKVTVVENAPRILARVASAETAAYFRDLHRSYGVTLHEGTGVVQLRGDSRVRSVVLSSGVELAVDFVVAGVGALPCTELAEAAGIRCDNGIAVDARGRTSAEHIWAAGDCTSFPWQGTRIRLECVQNAVEQAECVAADMMRQPVSYDPTPWFWSDQYDRKLQIAGMNAGYDQVVARRTSARVQSFWYFRAGSFCAVDAIDDPRAYLVGKQLLQAGSSPDPALLSDTQFDLKSLLTRRAPESA
ncbi:MAG: FAD-dependent oxidoreductase [Burkholderiaceae bacterium]|nr:FAD-dependent oxidoreductase [Burkholderiaceae bacterium]